MTIKASASSCQSLRHRRQSGFALVTALIVTAILAGVLLDASLRAEAERRAAINLAVDVRARAAARAGIAHLLLRLRALEALALAEDADPAFIDAWNRPDTLGLTIGVIELAGGAVYRVGVTDLGARLPLNYASTEEFARLFVALGATDTAAEDAAYVVVTARESLGRFGSVEDLARLQIPSLPGGWRENLTVFGDGRVNINTAPPAVLLALPGMTAESVDAVLERRAAGRWLHTVYELDALVTGNAQQQIRENFPGLAGRAAFSPSLVEVFAWGSVRGATMSTEISAIFARGGAVQIVSVTER